jgi:hypothetical protein
MAMTNGRLLQLLFAGATATGVSMAFPARIPTASACYKHYDPPPKCGCDCGSGELTGTTLCDENGCKCNKGDTCGTC